MSSRTLSLIGTLWLAIVACGPRLPRDFERQPVEVQVALYKRYIEARGTPSHRAQKSLTAGGRRAADALAGTLRAGDAGPFEREALTVLSRIQSRGTDLRGSRAERALELFLSGPVEDEVSRRMAKSTLAAIKQNYHASPRRAQE
jgi:hypothetical protein